MSSSRLMDPVSMFNQSPIKATFVCHIMLISWALSTLDWMPRVFMLYNLIFFLSLFWSLVESHNSEPVQLAAIINLLSILLDLMCIATNYPQYHFHDWFGFSLFLLICNLILRAVTSIVMLRVYNERNDRFGSYTGDSVQRPFVSGSRNGNYMSNARGYENLDSRDSAPTTVVVDRNTNNTTPLGNNMAPYQAVPEPILISPTE